MPKLEPDQVALLERYLHRTTGDGDLARSAAEYVLSGVGDRILGAIARLPFFSRSAARNSAPYVEYEDRYDVLASLVGLAEPAVLVRFARVCLAAETVWPLPTKSHTWPEAPWLEAWISTVGTYFSSPLRGRPSLLTCEHLVAMLESDGQTGESLVRAALEVEPAAKDEERYLARRRVQTLAEIPGYGGVLARYALLIHARLTQASALERVYLLDLLRKTDCDPEPFRSDLIEFATSSATTVRDAAEPLLARIKETARPDLERVAREGDSGRRAQAFRLLAKFYGAEAGDCLRQFESERLPQAAREALDRALAGVPRVEQRAPPPPRAIETNVPLSAAARGAFRELVAVQNSRMIEYGRQYGRPGATLDAAATERAIQCLEALVVPAGQEAPTMLVGLMDNVSFDSCAHFIDSADIQLIHVVRLLLLNYGIHDLASRSEYPMFLRPAGDLLNRFRLRHSFDMHQLAAVLRAVGIDDRGIVWSMCHWLSGCFLDWDSAVVGPFLLEHVPLLERLVRERPLSSPIGPTGAARFYRMLEHLPEIPASLVDRLWKLAIMSSSERDHARQVLEKLPDLEARMVKALRGGQAGGRASVALWLADRGTVSAVPAIRDALREEKQDSARQAMEAALERLGGRFEVSVDRDRLLFESAAVVKKGIPAGLSWFPFDRLAPVHWADSGEPVPGVILKRALIESHKLATPAPGPLLRRICAEFRADEREVLGQYVLDVWIARDLGDKAPPPPPPLSPAQAAQRALVVAAFRKYFTQMVPGYSFPPPSQSPSVPFYNPSSTATKDKGILALAAACAGDAAVRTVESYLKQWYGYRPAQCKALLGILPWIPSGAATQILLAVARKFRTRTIQEEAERLSREMAQRQGWTMDQLGDRTVPDAGFEADGAQQLALGGRTLTLRLTPQLTTELFTAEGKSMKSFPEPAKQDVEALYKEAKKAFSEARGTLRTVAAQQTQRLYEALCTERVWTFAELKEYLFEHPIVGRLCSRLIWRTEGQTFRPLGDGTLTNACDSKVEFDAAAEVRLAYCPQDADAWRRHLADYEVVPLFGQLDRPLHAPSDPSADALTDFRGHAIGFYQLRNFAAKFGYRHAPVVDGPVFTAYQKRFPGLDLDLELEFSGMELPGKDEPVFLIDLRFLQDGSPISLAEVPRVLFSECWHDLRSIAAAGSGYDPEWESKVR